MTSKKQNHHSSDGLLASGLNSSPLDHLVRMAKLVPLERFSIDLITGDVWLKYNPGATSTAPGDPVRKIPTEISLPAQEIFRILLAHQGEWVFGADIAAEMAGKPDHTSTAFSGPIRELRRLGLIETCRRRGYRVKPQV